MQQPAYPVHPGASGVKMSYPCSVDIDTINKSRQLGLIICLHGKQLIIHHNID